MMKFRLVTIIRDAVECGKVSFIEVHEPRGFGIADEEEEGDDAGDEDLSASRWPNSRNAKAAGLPVGGKKADLIARLSQEEEETVGNLIAKRALGSLKEVPKMTDDGSPAPFEAPP